MQAAADALHATPVDTELLSAALKATAAMARNLSPLHTGLLRAHVQHLHPAEAPTPAGADPVDKLPEALQFLFEVVVALQGEAAVGEVAKGEARSRQNAANAAIGLISDLAVNSADVRVVLQGEQAAEAWTGANPLCMTVCGICHAASLSAITVSCACTMQRILVTNHCLGRGLWCGCGRTCGVECVVQNRAAVQCGAAAVGYVVRAPPVTSAMLYLRLRPVL